MFRYFDNLTFILIGQGRNIDQIKIPSSRFRS